MAIQTAMGLEVGLDCGIGKNIYVGRAGGPGNRRREGITRRLASSAWIQRVYHLVVLPDGSLELLLPVLIDLLHTLRKSRNLAEIIGGVRGIPWNVPLGLGRSNVVFAGAIPVGSS